MSRRNSESKLGLLVAHELRSVLRDRKTLLLSVLLPLAIMPLLLLLTQWTQEQSEAADQTRAHPYALVGDAEELAWLAAELERGLAAWPEPEPEPGADAAAPPTLQRETPEDPVAALEAGEIDAYLRLAPADTDTGAESPRTIELHHQGNRESARATVTALTRALELARSETRAELLAAHGLPLDPEQLAPLRAEDVAEASASAGLDLGKFLTLALVLLLLPGGQVVAADIMAGEKERGTLETLLTTAASRHEIVLSKLLTIACVAMGITAINVANLLVYLGFGLLPGAATLAASLSPGTVAVVALLFVPVALLVAALLLMLSGYAGSYKEAQLFAFPVQLLVMVPALAPVLPNLELRSAIVAVPIANVAVACRDVLTGVFDWPMLAAVVLINTGLALQLARFVTRALEQERLMAPAAADDLRQRGGAVTFQHHVLRWVAALWAIFLIVSSYLQVDLRLQIAINLGLLFLGGSLVMVRVYGLDIREAWALRKPPPAAWLAVLIGAPCGMLVAQGLFVLASYVLPVPSAALESFSDQLLPDIPKWQLYLMLTLAPGVCEEVFFRGTLLHGLRKRLSPVALCVVTGVIFGIFHVALFRLIPTGFIGVMLGAVVLLTGSIFPAMLWHALNNLLGVLAGEAALTPLDTPAWLYLVALAGLALSFAILWRSRSPYPDLRGAEQRPAPSCLKETTNAP